jgi:cytochrome P450
MLSVADQFFVDAMSPAFRHDPYPLYERYRSELPLVRVADSIWFVLGHADVTALLRDPRLSTDESRAATEADVDDGAKKRSLLFLDPPDHTRLRSLVARAFTPRRIDALRPMIEQSTAALVAKLDGTVDLVDAFAYPLPVRVICRLLGVPDVDEPRFHPWSRALTRSLDPSILRTPEDDDAIAVAQIELTDYLTALLEERRRHPGDDVLSTLATTEATEDEILDLAALLLIAGHETTVNLIANGVLALLQHPDQIAGVRADPLTAVDELLRYDSPVQLTQRIVLEDLEVAGQPVRAGDELVLVLGAANRDPAAFDDPNRLDVARDARRHVSFGGGVHHCLGATLARLEGAIAIDGLLTAFPNLQLAGEPVRRPTFTLRGVEHLPVDLRV